MIFQFIFADVVVITSNFSTFAGVMSGIAILSGLICFVLHLFNQNMYGTRHNRHRFGNANLPPPILFSSDPGKISFYYLCIYSCIRVVRNSFTCRLKQKSEGIIRKEKSN